MRNALTPNNNTRRKSSPKGQRSNWITARKGIQIINIYPNSLKRKLAQSKRDKTPEYKKRKSLKEVKKKEIKEE